MSAGLSQNINSGSWCLKCRLPCEEATALSFLRMASPWVQRYISKYPNSKNFNVIDPDCLAKAAADARWSYEGMNAMSWVFFFFSTLFILSRFLNHDIMGLMGGHDSLHTLAQVLPGLLVVRLLQK